MALLVQLHLHILQGKGEQWPDVTALQHPNLLQGGEKRKWLLAMGTQDSLKYISSQVLPWTWLTEATHTHPNPALLTVLPVPEVQMCPVLPAALGAVTTEPGHQSSKGII